MWDAVISRNALEILVTKNNGASIRTVTIKNRNFWMKTYIFSHFKILSALKNTINGDGMVHVIHKNIDVGHTEITIL